MNEEFLQLLASLIEAGTPCVVATLVTIKGSAPQEIGARIIVGTDGLIFGTVGGGKVEAKAIALAKDLLAMESKHQYVEWNLQTDVGMTCGGVVGLFFEKVNPRSEWNIAIFGAGHVSQELIRILVKLDCSITCIDLRLDWLNKLPDHFKLKKIQLDDMKSALKTLSPKTFIISVTMGHAFDLPILTEAMTNFNFPYIGAIGSEAKARVLRADMIKNGVDEKSMARLRCPIGESFGNNQPVEIAISIVAQILSVRDHNFITNHPG